MYCTVHEADKESKDELEGRKWTGGLYMMNYREESGQEVCTQQEKNEQELRTW